MDGIHVILVEEDRGTLGAEPACDICAFKNGWSV